jgi:hypothetical protein
MIERYGKESWFVGYESESLVGKGQYDWRENWSRQNIIDKVVMLYQSIRVFRNGSCEINYTRADLCNYNAIE